MFIALQRKCIIFNVSKTSTTYLGIQSGSARREPRACLVSAVSTVPIAEANDGGMLRASASREISIKVNSFDKPFVGFGR